MLIRNILNLKGGAVYSIESAATLTLAVGLMVRHDIGSLVVMENGRMAGLLTFREVLRALDVSGASLADLHARDVMVANPVCGRPDDTIDELRQTMTQHHIRYLPVTDGDRLLGIVSLHDVVKAIIKETSMENRLLKRYIESASAQDASQPIAAASVDDTKAP